MTKENTSVSGGCQCGAVRYRIERLGRATICHCRMCQKAFGNFFGPLVTAKDLTWTRGKIKTFASSKKIKRGFCEACGTPMTYDWGGDIEVAIGTLDNPNKAAPVLHVNPNDKLPFVDELHKLPVREEAKSDQELEFFADNTNYQHPDHDT